MDKFIDLIGKTFNALTPFTINENETKIKKKYYYDCKCKCGNIITVSIEDLTSGRIKSCGCIIKHDPVAIGQVFGRYTVLEIDEEMSKRIGRKCFKCKCECGTIKSVRASDLVNGKTLSCGCLNRDITSGPKNHMINKKYARLKVLSINEEETKRHRGKYHYNCICDCGNNVVVSGYALRSGRTKSCGCLQRERASKLNSKQNELILYDELGYGIGYFNNSNNHFIFDIGDTDVVKKHCWSDNGGYAASCEHIDGKSKNIRLHTEIMKKHGIVFNDDEVADHKNHNKSDDRFSNLRKGTNSNNSRNTIAKPTNTGERNIYYDKERNRYIVTIYHDNKRDPDVVFRTLIEARVYRDNKYKEYGVEDFVYNPEEDYRFNNEFIMTPYTYVNPKNLPIIDPFYYYPSIPEKPLINPFVIVDPDKFYNS